MLGFSQHMDPRLFGREIIFEEFQRMWSRYLNVTDRQLTVASPRSALASRAKNGQKFSPFWLASSGSVVNHTKKFFLVMYPATCIKIFTSKFYGPSTKSL